MKDKSHKFVHGFLLNFGLVVLGIILFALSFPNVLFDEGLSLLAWVAYIPVFVLIRRVNVGASIFWGALYGYGAYSVFNYWLSVFHPIAGLVVGLIYLFYFAVVFPLLKLAIILFPRRGYLVQWLVWLGFEYVRTLGFLGYSYGIAGYSQWNVPPILQLASLGGVWLVSALVVFPSALLGNAIQISHERHERDEPHERNNSDNCSWGLLGLRGSWLKNEKIPAFIFCAALIASLIYGFVSQVNYADAPKVKLSLIQQNNDPWLGGPAEYAANFKVLRRLSEAALAEAPDSDMVVWSETAFVPRIFWHLTYRDEPEYWPLVKDLMDFLAGQKTPYLIGNDDARKKVGAQGYWELVDYNAVMLYQKDELIELYRKMHLVPFTEHFPYEKQLPFLYKFLEARDDIHWWEAGTEATVFELPTIATSGGSEVPINLKFSTPVCFEDTFGYLSRKFVRAGAGLIVNLSNDAWSHCLPAQYQHLSMAAFRAVENRRAMARSTASGQTCAIDPNGKILAMAPAFEEAYLNVEVPVVGARSLYTRIGDALGAFCALAAAALLLFGGARAILKQTSKGRQK